VSPGAPSADAEELHHGGGEVVAHQRVDPGAALGVADPVADVEVMLGLELPVGLVGFEGLGEGGLDGRRMRVIPRA
jgi:hypothetical protein